MFIDYQKAAVYIKSCTKVALLAYLASISHSIALMSITPFSKVKIKMSCDFFSRLEWSQLDLKAHNHPNDAH
jgi:hypothetical protein